MVARNKKLYRISDVMPSAAGKPEKKSRSSNRARKTNHSLLLRAEQAWENLRKSREIAERTEGYTFNDDQWGDIIDVDGKQMTEREYIAQQGSVPLTDNMMISIFSSVTGLYDKQGSEPRAFARTNDAAALSDMMTATMQTNWTNAHVARTLSVGWRQFLTSGVMMTRSSWEEMPDGIPDIGTHLVSFYKAFWEAGTDPNLSDLTLIGQLCDVPKEKLYQTFAPYGLSIDEINSIYHISPTTVPNASALGYKDDFWDDGDGVNSDYQNERNTLKNISFLTANTPHSYRVIEVWTTKAKPRYQCWDPIAPTQEQAYFKIEREQAEIDAVNRINNMRRQQFRDAGMPVGEAPVIQVEPIVDVFWYFTFLAPDGTVLCEGESPYDHKSHPFTLLLYPYVNGKIYPFMSFIIDQQRNINRLNIMNDLAIRSATKGLTIYPEDIIPDDMTPEEFDRSLTSYRGVVRYKINQMNANARPDILTSNAANLGINEMLQMKINLMQQTSNVSSALQGKTPSAGTAASRYQMETENSTTSLFTIINDFSGFMENLALKICELIKQYYENGRLVFVDTGNIDVMAYDALSARDVKFKMSIKESAATAAHRQTIVDSLNRLLEMQAIDILTYLDNSPEPYAKALAQQIRQQQQQGMLGQQPIQVPGADQQQVMQAQNIMQNASPISAQQPTQ